MEIKVTITLKEKGQNEKKVVLEIDLSKFPISELGEQIFSIVKNHFSNND